jgi:hypothetical protein
MRTKPQKLDTCDLELSWQVMKDGVEHLGALNPDLNMQTRPLLLRVGS